jgi:hypothetical protein
MIISFDMDSVCATVCLKCFCVAPITGNYVKGHLTIYKK